MEELEGHLRDQIDTLSNTGLSRDEAFLIAMKRIGDLDDLSRRFMQEHSDLLWRQVILPADTENPPRSADRAEMLVVFGLAIASALAIKVPELVGLQLDAESGFYERNFSIFVLPFLAYYLAWKRRWGANALRWLAPMFIVAGAFANLYVFAPGGSTEVLTALHLPIVVWMLVGVAYVGGQVRSAVRRMDFVRFSGELFIYYVLIALGGGVLTAITVGMFGIIGLDLEWMAGSWMLPCGAMGAVIVGAWLVESKQGVIQNMAPVLARVFTPLFAIVLLAFLATIVWIGNGIEVEREVLISLDLLLVLVLGLLLYNVSARDHKAQPNAFDVLQMVLVVSALVIDVLALMAIMGRTFESGFSANRVAALGENLILLVNLTWSAWLYFRFLSRRGAFAVLERWQATYLPIYPVWAVVVVVGFPPAFGYT